jgi:hypothetical protein
MQINERMMIGSPSLVKTKSRACLQTHTTDTGHGVRSEGSKKEASIAEQLIGAKIGALQCAQCDRRNWGRRDCRPKIKPTSHLCLCGGMDISRGSR